MVDFEVVNSSLSALFSCVHGGQLSTIIAQLLKAQCQPVDHLFVAMLGLPVHIFTLVYLKQPPKALILCRWELHRARV